MLELRILSGLHRGATLPLDSRTHLIGAAEDMDVVLVDPDMEQRHAALTLTEGGWELAALDGRILSADSNEARNTLLLAPGDFARIGAVWVTVIDQDARWQNPPPEPVDQPAVVPEPPAPQEPAALVEPPAFEGKTSTSPELSSQPPAEPMEEAADTAPSSVSPVSSASPSGDAPRAPGRNRLAAMKQHLKGRFRSRRAVYTLVAIVTVLFGAAAYAITATTDIFQMPAQKKAMSPSEEASNAAPTASSSGKTVKSGKSGKPADKTVAKAFDALHSDTSPTRTLTGDELRKAFRKRLSEADLIKRFDLTLQENQWFMQAALDDEETARFERILADFIKTHNITFPVQAKIGGADAMLPFKIRQVISGANARVITDDGQQLFIGDEHRGVRLVAIQGNRISFGGKRKIEVKW